MTQCKTVKLSNSQLNKVKSGMKNDTKATLNLSSNVIGDSNDETSFPHKLLLTDTQDSRLREAFVNNKLACIKLSKTQLSKMLQLGGFSGPFLLFLGSKKKKNLESTHKIAKSLEKEVKQNKVLVNFKKDVPKFLSNTGINVLNKKFYHLWIQE